MCKAKQISVHILLSGYILQHLKLLDLSVLSGQTVYQPLETDSQWDRTDIYIDEISDF